MLTVGLTGGIASGKSTIARYLSELGAVCVDADLLAHEMMAKGTGVYRRLVDHFGAAVLTEDGAIDRSALATIVFDRPTELAYLNEAVHPAVIEGVARLLEEWRAADPGGIGVVQVPLLVEADMVRMFDVVVVVVSSPEQQISRLIEMGMAIDQGLARLRSQISDDERLPWADFTIINKGDLALLKEQTGVLYAGLKERAGESREGY